MPIQGRRIIKAIFVKNKKKKGKNKNTTKPKPKPKKKKGGCPYCN